MSFPRKVIKVCGEYIFNNYGCNILFDCRDPIESSQGEHWEVLMEK